MQLTKLSHFPKETPVEHTFQKVVGGRKKEDGGGRTDKIVLGPKQFQLQSRCPLCHSGAFRELGRPCYQRIYEVPLGRVMLDQETIRQRVLVRCSDCDLVYNRFIPRAATLDYLYNLPTDGRTWKFVTKGRHMDDKLGFLSFFPREEKLRVLDVGCYTGGFLSLLPEHWIKHGIDPIPQALDVAKKSLPAARFTQASLKDFQGPDGSYDLITLWDVAEHLDDLDGALRKVSSLLAKGGILVIETGDVGSVFARVMRQGWWYVNILEHFSFFSRDTLKRALPRYGLEVMTCKKTMHHFDWAQAFKTQPLFWGYFAITLGGRVSAFWVAISNALNRRGYSQIPASRDHVFLIARKAAKSSAA
jgi:2-polyprenyl-3-methyl-5-hydroxy-6-metoxy-1,4-benzoquinol methylase